MKYRQATVCDLDRIKILLKHNNLPFSDCDEQIDNFVVLENQLNLIAIGGIEIYGHHGLMRSFVVAQDQRSKGISKNMFNIIKEKAISLGVTSIYLLTETATEYFEKLGFRVIKRTEVPESIKNTKQYKELCPNSATVMKYNNE